MISMLNGVDASKNSTFLSGSLENKLNCTINNSMKGGVLATTFCFTDIIKDVHYTFLTFTFKNGVFSGFSDTSIKYSNGDTTVNISEEQALDIAKEYTQNYSYAMPDGSMVGGFNVTRFSPTLRGYAAGGSTVLKPCWDVNLWFNQTYPGSVHGLEVLFGRVPEKSSNAAK
jgi:hypothetical protein